MPVYYRLVSDGCHMMCGVSPDLGFLLFKHVILNGGAASVRDRTRAEGLMKWTGILTLHAALTISAAALLLYALRTVPRRADALLRMTLGLI